MPIERLDMRPLLMTWALWRHMWQPDFEHPMFRYYRQTRDSGRAYPGWLWAGGVGLLVIALFALVLNPSATLFLVMTLAVSAPLLLLAMNGLVFGGLFTLSVTSGLLSYNRLAASDLMQITPLGTLGFALFVASARLHRGKRLYTLNRFLRLCVGVGLLACALVALILGVTIFSTERFLADEWRWLMTLLPIACLFVVIYLDHVQSTVLAVLSGLIATRVIHDRMQARIAAMALFLNLYLLPGIAVVMIAVLLRFALAAYWHLTSVQMLVAIGTMLELYLLREGLVAACWRFILVQHQVTPGETITNTH
ncbi:hypothetical protein G4Y79_11075 [Phototrophicus methaneseepsis]|uniref:Uncharacterized protein n=1 Tax=Phototrophicus methaneseepsis TaxID=2710758 RepID=A0A7S8IGN3_9CHLR|nr:hypothetical protein [Phototrophicus methaneseepsis]QPC84882.1 hypothetical protein G4Y79_11075 [Phototrophicus methaneseepsis]